MKTRLTVLFVITFICLGCTSTGRQETSEPESTEKTGPRIITKSWDDTGSLPKDYTCTAEGPTTGILDANSQRLSKLEIWKGKQTIKEIATYSDKPIKLTVTVGGCAHYGAQYTFEMDDSHPISDRKYYLNKVLQLLADVPHKIDGSQWHKSIAEAVEKNAGKKDSFESCSFTDTPGYSRAICGFERNAQNQAVMRIGYDVAL